MLKHSCGDILNFVEKGIFVSSKSAPCELNEEPWKAISNLDSGDQILVNYYEDDFSNCFTDV